MKNYKFINFKILDFQTLDFPIRTKPDRSNIQVVQDLSGLFMFAFSLSTFKLWTF